MAEYRAPQLVLPFSVLSREARVSSHLLAALRQPSGPLGLAGGLVRLRGQGSEALVEGRAVPASLATEQRRGVVVDFLREARSE